MPRVTSRSFLRASFLAALCLAAVEPIKAVADEPAAIARHVVVIGIDGLGPYGIRKAATPHLHRLMEQGSWSLKARGVIPTVSSPNWASMINGAGPEQHGVTSNDWRVDKFEIAPTFKGPRGYFPTMFSVLRDRNPKARIAIVHDWDGFRHLFEPGVADLVLHPKGEVETTQKAVEEIRANKPVLTFIHLDHVDGAGHKDGHGTPAYFRAVEEADRLVGEILKGIDEAGIADKTLVLVTADHGGVGKKHGGSTMAEIEIPWIVRGPRVKAGHELKTAVNTYDTAATVTHALGLTAPDCWVGKPVVEAFATPR